MTDTFTKEVRSNIMRAVKSKGNKSTEGKLIYPFKEKKLTGWRRNYPIFGKPDFLFPQKKLPYSQTALSGMAITVEIFTQNLTLNIGCQKSQEIKGSIKK